MIEDLHWQDATEIARRIRDGEITAVAALEHFLERVHRLNPALNAIVDLDEPAARARAEAADVALARGELWGALHGVPITIKNSFEVTGMTCTVGSPMLKDHRPTRNATVAQRLIDAGAILFGKTNTPEMCADLQTSNPIHGISRNPYNTDTIVGGSSGGSAAALAAGLTSLEFGSDIGGSTRNPAHFNNVYGMRPTWGTISPIGHIPGPPNSLSIEDFATPGPLARSARDLRLAFDIARGSDPRFGRVMRHDLPEPAIDRLADLRVGLWMDDERVPVDAPAKAVFDAALAKLRAAGVTQMEDSRPDFDQWEAYLLYIRMGGAITGAATPPAEREQMRTIVAEAEARGEGGDTGIQRMKGVLMTFADWLAASHERGVLFSKWAEYFERHDIMLSPIMSVASLPHGENVFARPITINGETQVGREQLFWAAQQVVASLPCVIVPAGFTEAGAPCGIQVTAAQYHDYHAIRAAELIGAALGADRIHPRLPGD